MYQLTGVTKTYQKGRAKFQALRGVDLEIKDGEFLAIQGPTGHGKTTLLQMLGGLDRPTSGIVQSTARTWPRCARPRSPRSARTRSASSSRPST